MCKCENLGHYKEYIYECDPNKNTECTKESCFINGGPCSRTFNKEYAKEV